MGRADGGSEARRRWLQGAGKETRCRKIDKGQAAGGGAQRQPAPLCLVTRRRSPTEMPLPRHMDKGMRYMLAMQCSKPLHKRNTHITGSGWAHGWKGGEAPVCTAGTCALPNTTLQPHPRCTAANPTPPLLTWTRRQSWGGRCPQTCLHEGSGGRESGVVRGWSGGMKRAAHTCWYSALHGQPAGTPAKGASNPGLTREVSRRVALPHRQAHQPVAQDACVSGWASGWLLGAGAG